MTDPATFWIALVGLLLSVISITWQFVEWTYSGARVRVDFARGFIGYTDGRMRDALLFTARNVGRSPAELTGWGIRLRDGNRLVMMQPDAFMAPAMPTTLAGGHAVDFRWPDDLLVPELARHKVSDARIRGFVRLATGKEVLSTEHTLQPLR